MKYISNIFISIDQFGNVLAGGNPDNTISSRVGYYTEKYYDKEDVPLKWKIFKSIINFTFFPIDGRNHCKEAYYNDAGEEFDEGTSDIAIAVLALIIILSCVVISMVLYSLYSLGIVNPKNINRSENIKFKLKTSEAKLKGILTELNQYKVIVDNELDDIIESTKTTIEEIVEKIEGMLNLKSRLIEYKNRKL